MKELENKLNSIRNRVNVEIDNYFSSLRGVNDELLQAMKYSITSGGKRLRPCMLVLFYELCGGKSELIYKVACAIEMIHTYSLIHDDLPCLDNDEERRGCKTTHVVYGEAVALLAGDAFITQAFELLFSKEIVDEFGAKIMLDVAQELANAAGASGMVSGQMDDIKLAANDDIIEEKLIDMYKKKTGKLFSASAKIGVICARIGNKYLDLANSYGEYFGVAFQLYDDIFDTEQDDEKITYISVYKKEKTKSLMDSCVKKAFDLLEEYEGDSSYLMKLAQKLTF